MKRFNYFYISSQNHHIKKQKQPFKNYVIQLKCISLVQKKITYTSQEPSITLNPPKWT